MKLAKSLILAVGPPLVHFPKATFNQLLAADQVRASDNVPRLSVGDEDY